MLQQNGTRPHTTACQISCSSPPNSASERSSRDGMAAAVAGACMPAKSPHVSVRTSRSPRPVSRDSEDCLLNYPFLIKYIVVLFIAGSPVFKTGCTHVLRYRRSKHLSQPQHQLNTIVGLLSWSTPPTAIRCAGVPATAWPLPRRAGYSLAAAAPRPQCQRSISGTRCEPIAPGSGEVI